MLEEIRELYDYNRWANHRMLDAVARLPEAELTREVGGSFPTVQATLAHAAGAEWLWLRRWRGTSPTSMPEGWTRLSLGELRREWAEIESGQRDFLDGLSEPDLLRPMTYRTLAGNESTNLLGQVLRHVVNHATYHRGQMTTLIRQLGGEPVATDLIVFYRE